MKLVANLFATLLVMLMALTAIGTADAAPKSKSRTRSG